MPARQPDSSTTEVSADETFPKDSLSARRDGSGASASLDQFRQVLEDQRRQTAQLQSLLESRFSAGATGGGAADKVETLVSKIETLATRLDSIGNGGNGQAGQEKPAIPPQVNGLMLRVGELERKITEATPEPLLKEIIFRLGSLEDAVGQSPDGGGIGEIRERVKALERQKTEQASPGPRVDELTARLAALENAPGPTGDARVDEVLTRLHSLEDHAGESGFMARLEEIEEQIESLRAALDGGNRDGLKDIEQRIAAIENAEATAGGGSDDARLTDLSERLKSLEMKAAEAGRHDDSPEWADRLNTVESWDIRLAALEEKAVTPDPRIDGISAQLEKLDSLDSLTQRLGKVEKNADTPPCDPRVDGIESKLSSLAALTDRLEALEGKTNEPAADPRVDGIESRLNSLEEITARVVALETKTAEPAADPRVDEIKARLGAMADVAHMGDVESRVSSLTTRLDALKMITDGLKATQKPGASADPRVDALAAQFDELKTLAASRDGDAAATHPPAWDDLLHRVDTLEKDGTPTANDPRFTELAARLASLEKSGSGGADPRITEILARLNTFEPPDSGAAAAEIPAGLIARIESVEKRLSGAPATGTDPLLAQLRERWDILEERMLRFEETISEGAQTESGQTGDDLRGQVAELRGKIDALGAGGAAADLDPQTVSALREMTKNGPPSGGAFDFKTVKSQMTFVYFSIGMLYAICAYAGYVMISSH